MISVADFRTEIKDLKMNGREKNDIVIKMDDVHEQGQRDRWEGHNVSITEQGKRCDYWQ